MGGYDLYAALQNYWHPRKMTKHWKSKQLVYIQATNSSRELQLFGPWTGASGLQLRGVRGSVPRLIPED